MNAQDTAVGACPFPANVDPQRHADWVAGWHARGRREQRSTAPFIDAGPTLTRFHDAGVERAVASEWRTAIEDALGCAPDPVNHTLEWARVVVREIREIGNRHGLDKVMARTLLDAIKSARLDGTDALDGGWGVVEAADALRATLDPCDKCDDDRVVVVGFDARSGEPGRNEPCPKCSPRTHGCCRSAHAAGEPCAEHDHECGDEGSAP